MSRPPLPTLPFGRTGHASSRVVFGAAALWRCSQDEADRALDLLLEHGVNHIDAAASYGEAELRVGAWLARGLRERFFLATKTGERSYARARDQIHASLERLRTERVDLIQLHNLVKPDEWEQALGPDGALRAALEAREQGLVRYIGVTGHGTRVAAMHARSLARFPFDSVLLPYGWALWRDERYAAEFEALAATCRARGVAVQTIKAVARRRWPEGQGQDAATWYEPLRAPEDLARALHWALARPDVFVCSPGDLGLLQDFLDAAARFERAPAEAAMREQAARAGVEPLFVRGYGAAPEA
jgi:aryl-alcohol dehydrogenase-like predicted oxidoreductase